MWMSIKIKCIVVSDFHTKDVLSLVLQNYAVDFKIKGLETKNTWSSNLFCCK